MSAGRIQDEHSASFPDVGQVTCMCVRVVLAHSEKAFRVSPTARMTGVLHILPASVEGVPPAVHREDSKVRSKHTRLCFASVLHGGIGYLRAELEPQVKLATVRCCMCAAVHLHILQAYHSEVSDWACRVKGHAQPPRPPRQGGWTCAQAGRPSQQGAPPWRSRRPASSLAGSRAWQEGTLSPQTAHKAASSAMVKGVRQRHPQ